MSDTFGERLKAIRLSRGMTQEELAELLDTTKQVISRYESGKRAPKITVAYEYASKLGVPLAALLNDMSADVPKRVMPYPSHKLVPVLGTVRCGSNGLAVEEPEGYEPADVENPSEYFYLRADGDSMEPYIYEGDYVLVHKQDDVDSGELAIVIVGGEEGTLKKVLKQANSIILQPFNARYPARIFVGHDCESIRIVGRVTKTTHNW